MSELAIQEQPRILAALSASEMETTQQQLTTWCALKLKALAKDYREQRENMRVAKAAKWKHSAWSSAMSRTKGKIVYYSKIWAAVKAGYVVVPSFDAEVMAVRVHRKAPSDTVTWSRDKAQTAEPQLLPAGAGRYVDDQQPYDQLSEEVSISSQPGKTRTETNFWPIGYSDEIDFPIAVVKPIVMDATQRAMALRIFDRVLVAGAAKKDPIVLGEIIAPKVGYSQKRITFFIAWWLDVDTL